MLEILRLKRCAALCGLVLFGATQAQGTIVNLGASEFNTIYQSSVPTGQTSGGASVYIFAGTTDDSSARRGLIQFDLSSIPTYATITGASLSLVFDKSKGTNTLPATLYRLTDSWGEGDSPTGVTAGGGGGNGSPSAQNDATWLYRFYNASNPTSSLAWTNAGGDYVPTASAITNITGEQGTLVNYSWTGSGVAADVQAWVNSPSSNFGWLLEGDETQIDTSMRFQSPDSTYNGQGNTANALPVLTVSYSVPEPAGVTGAFLSAGLLARRRRR